MPDIVRETPRTELASMQFGKILKSLSKPAYDIIVKVVSDIATEAAKKVIGL